LSYETIPIEAKNASRTHVLTGTYVEAGAGDNTANVTVDIYGLLADIPIFYHCPDSETADGNPFAADDRVLVTNSGEGAVAANMKVIGFEDGLPRNCGFQFKFTRGETTLITEADDLSLSISVYNSDDVGVSITTPIYNQTTEFWEFNIADVGDFDPDGYWIDYNCDDGLLTQYPFKYKEDDKDKTEDLIHVGTYEGDIPFWKVTEPVSITGTLGCTGTGRGSTIWTNFIDDLAQISGYVYIDGDIYTKTLKVEASIPYQVWWKLRNKEPRLKNAHEKLWVVDTITYQSGVCWNGSEWVVLATICCTTVASGNWTACSFSNDGRGAEFVVTGGTISETVDDDNAVVPQDSKIVFQGSIGGAEHSAVFTNIGDEELPDACSDGPRAATCLPCDCPGVRPYSFNYWYPAIHRDIMDISASYDWE